MFAKLFSGITYVLVFGAGTLVIAGQMKWGAVVFAVALVTGWCSDVLERFR